MRIAILGLVAALSLAGCTAGVAPEITVLELDDPDEPVIMKVRLKNVDESASIYASASNFQLRDANGVVTEISDQLYSMSSGAFPFGIDLEPGDSAEGYLIFEVPSESALPFTLRYNPTFGDSTSVVLE